VTTHALAIVGHISAQDSPIAVTQTPLWFQVTQAVAAVATTIGVLIALYVATIREPKKAAAERRRHKAQIEAFHRFEMKRIAAQARKVVPSCDRSPVFGDSWWTVRIDNSSNAVTTILDVDVKAIDCNGIEVPDGCMRANHTMRVDQAFDRSVRALSKSLEGTPQQIVFDGEVRLAKQVGPAFKQAVRDAMVGHFVKEWPRHLPPNQCAVMAYTTTDPNHELCITIHYEDEVGFQWRRTDTSEPMRVDEPVF
jgi:hypothetical protein